MQRLLLILLGALVAVSVHSVPTGATAEGTLVLSPTSGVVGSSIHITGTSCNNPGQNAHLYFLGVSPSGPTGAVDIYPTIPVDSEGRFSVTFTIPSQLDPYQGRGGGAVVPGQYRIESLPPVCSADFTVTGPSSLPSTGGPPGQEQDPSRVLAISFGLLLSAFGLATLATAAKRVV